MKRNKEEIIEAIWTTIWAITQVAFIVLRLFKIITWSWWWILSPIWGLFALAVAVFLIMVIIVGVYYMTGVMKIYWKHWRGKI